MDGNESIAQRQFKGIWIPAEIWLDRNLSWNEKILLLEVDSFTGNGQLCFFSNDYLAELLGVSDRQVRTYISHLVELGYLAQPVFDGRTRYLESRLGDFQAEWKSTSGQGGSKLPGRVEVNFRHNNTKVINNDINLSPSKEVERERTRARFVPPTVEDVQAYISEKGYDVDAEAFVNFYASKGWKVGNAAMKDWKAATITWHKRHQDDAKRRTSSPTPPPRSEKGNYVLAGMRTLDQLHGTDFYGQYMKKKNGRACDEQ